MEPEFYRDRAIHLRKKRPATWAGQNTVGGNYGLYSLTSSTTGSQLEFQRFSALTPHNYELQRLARLETA